MALTASPSFRIRPHTMETLCAVSPHPDLLDRIRSQFREAQESFGDLLPRLRLAEPTAVGLNDGLIFPGSLYPVGTTAAIAQRGALDRAPLRGTLRVVVVLVDFSDKAMTQSEQHFRDLFFSTSVLPHGSVKEYYTEVTGGLITIDGDVLGPLRMPHPLSYYAGSGSGLQGSSPNARDLAHDAAVAADPLVNFGPYDNDGNGFVDAFIVVHAGQGAEVTGATGDIWSHKWVLPSAYSADGTNIYAYLTIPEDARIGVSAHELGHLLFGWPDLYDTDYSSAGIGDWCLMAGGSWGGGGDIPVHPSAWCKLNQGWANAVVPTTNATVTITDVKSSKQVYRLWKDGGAGSEYFLVEVRDRTGYDQSLPGPGMLIWHVDDAISGNTNENHPQVALVQADGQRQLELNVNRGDAGDPYPGTSGNTAFSSTTTPNSKSYGGVNTCVSVTSISPAGPSMTARLTVTCITKGRLKKEIHKEVIKDIKDLRKDGKEFAKELRDDKARVKDIIDNRKPLGKEVDKPITDKGVAFDKPGDKLTDGRPPDLPGGGGLSDEQDLGGRVAALEAIVQALLASQSGGEQAAAFIAPEERPDLSRSALREEEDLERLRDGMRQGAPGAKRLYDTGQ
jgi:immune inhibitor A